MAARYFCGRYLLYRSPDDTFWSNVGIRILKLSLCWLEIFGRSTTTESGMEVGGSFGRCENLSKNEENMTQRPIDRLTMGFCAF
jgi:hypothetical protein